MAGEQPQNYWQPPEDEQQQGTAPVPEPQVAEPVFTAASTEPLQPIAEPVTEELPEPTELAPQDTPDNPPITWNAQEYVHSERSPLWFIIFVVVVLGLIAVDVFLLKSWTFSALVIVMAIALVIYIRRPPRTLTYALSPAQGLYVGERLYHFDDFKSFGLIQDGPHYSIMLIPRKRFAPGVSVYFPDEAGERIVDILGQRLPMETLKLDIVDVIVRKLRL